MKATFFFRGGGVIISSVSNENTPEYIAQRMTSGGHVVAHDDYWSCGERWVPINLADVSFVIMVEEE